MTSRLSQLLESFQGNPPSGPADIEAFERLAKWQLPEGYRDFLLHANGGEGFVGPEAYIILWRLEDLQSLNEAYEVELNAPGVILVGSDGGGEAYGFDFRAAGTPVVALPFVGMDRELIRAEAQDFTAFLEKLFRCEFE